MAKEHKISWLNMPGYIPETWNPIIGCTEKSEGCKNCFAKRMARRLMHMPHTSYYQFVLADNGEDDPEKFKNIPEWNGQTHLVESKLTEPFKWKSPRMVFTVDMGDLFHETVPFEWIDQVFDVILDNPENIFIILTKRPERMKEYMDYREKSDKYYGHSWVWLGVTAENQEQANKRIPILLQIPAAKRFVSVEPMLGPVDFDIIVDSAAYYRGYTHRNLLSGILTNKLLDSYCATPGEKLDWVICGGESGPKARPMHPDWVKSVRDQCKAAGTPFFFKQWGTLLPSCQISNKVFFGMHKKEVQFPSPHNPSKMNTYLKLGSKASGDWLDNTKHHEWPKINL